LAYEKYLRNWQRVIAAPRINRRSATRWVLAMSIRFLAKELYRVMKEVEHLEKDLADMAPGRPERNALERRLMAARAEERRIKAMMEGAKAD
jgi:hypothetical protein